MTVYQFHLLAPWPIIEQNWNITETIINFYHSYLKKMPSAHSNCNLCTWCNHFRTDKKYLANRPLACGQHICPFWTLSPLSLTSLTVVHSEVIAVQDWCLIARALNLHGNGVYLRSREVRMRSGCTPNISKHPGKALGGKTQHTAFLASYS